MKLKNKVIAGVLGLSALVITPVAISLTATSCSTGSSTNSSVSLNKDAITQLLLNQLSIKYLNEIKADAFASQINRYDLNQKIVAALKQNSNHEIANAGNLANSSLKVIARPDGQSVWFEVDNIPTKTGGTVNLNIVLSGFQQ